jgi:hypothetical protein
MASWSVDKPPCSEYDPLCAPCTLTTPAASCGTSAPSDAATPTLPRWYCNYQGVACHEGRVSGVDLTGLGVNFTTLPAAIVALERLENLSEF